MKPLLLAILLLLPIQAHADYRLYVKYWCGWHYVTATYDFKTLQRARIYQEVFRRVPKYRNCWIRWVRGK